jgi:hypothetical protein
VLEFLAYVDDVRPFIKKMMVHGHFDYQRALKIMSEANLQKTDEKNNDFISNNNTSKTNFYDNYSSPLRSPSLTASKWNSSYLTPDVVSPSNKNINIKIINNNNNHYIITPQDSLNTYMSQPNPTPQETKSIFNSFRKSHLTDEVKYNNYTSNVGNSNNAKAKQSNNTFFGNNNSYMNEMDSRYNLNAKPIDKPSYLSQKYNLKTVNLSLNDNDGLSRSKPTEAKTLNRTSIQQTSNFRNYSTNRYLTAESNNQRPSTSMTGKDRNYRENNYMQRVPSTSSLLKQNDRSYFGYSKDTRLTSPITRPMTSSSSAQKFNTTTVYDNRYGYDDVDKRGYSHSSRSNSKVNTVQRDTRLNNNYRTNFNFSKLLL